MNFEAERQLETALVLKEAFKRSLRHYIGPSVGASVLELQAWSLALLELASEYREVQFGLEDYLRIKAEDPK